MILNKNIEDVALESIKEYTQYVTSSRVLPHLDLKPVHRRVLWSMIRINARAGKGMFKKSATIIGESLKLHPHGDASVYSAVCHLINTPNPLVTGRGNFGSRYGDPAAASRYTEAKTSDLFEYLLDPFMVEIGDFVPSYDEMDREPILFQTKLPLVYLTGVYGIGVGLTVANPAFHVSKVKYDILKLLDKSTKEPINKYSYGGVVLNNRVFPTCSINKSGDREYLHITELPIGVTVSILSESGLIQELQATKQIEVIDESTINKTSIKIWAPEHVQSLILKSTSRPIINDLKYYWKKYRVSGFLEEWMSERIKFIKKKHYFDSSNKFLKSLEGNISFDLSLTENPTDNIENVVSKWVDRYSQNIPLDALNFLSTKEEITEKMWNKSLRSLKNSSSSEIPEIREMSKDDAKNQVYKEICDIDDSMFSKTSKTVISIPKTKYNNEIKRFITLKENSVEVRFKITPRILNWEIKKPASIVFNNGLTETIPDYFFGLKQYIDRKIVGFTIQGEVAVVLTESKKIITTLRISNIKEPIQSIFTAKKLLVNGKEIVVKSGITIDNVSSWKIQEI